MKKLTGNKMMMMCMYRMCMRCRANFSMSFSHR